MFFKVGVLKNFANFTGKHLYWSLILINFIKKRLQHRVFPVEFAKFLRTPLFYRVALVASSIFLIFFSKIVLC